jgi:hypothetical protein
LPLLLIYLSDDLPPKRQEKIKTPAKTVFLILKFAAKRKMEGKRRPTIIPFLGK